MTTETGSGSDLNPQRPPVSKAILWTGRVISTLIVLLMSMSAIMKFAKPPSVVEGFAHLGIAENLIVVIAILELVSIVIYAIPRTAVIGAILTTGYLGGAILACLRVGDPVFPQAILGVLVWGGLFLRDPRLRVLIPLRR